MAIGVEMMLYYRRCEVNDVRTISLRLIAQWVNTLHTVKPSISGGERARQAVQIKLHTIRNSTSASFVHITAFEKSNCLTFKTIRVSDF